MPKKPFSNHYFCKFHFIQQIFECLLRFSKNLLFLRTSSLVISFSGFKRGVSRGHIIFSKTNIRCVLFVAGYTVLCGMFKFHTDGYFRKTSSFELSSPTDLCYKSQFSDTVHWAPFDGHNGVWSQVCCGLGLRGITKSFQMWGEGQRCLVRATSAPPPQISSFNPPISNFSWSHEPLGGRLQKSPQHATTAPRLEQPPTTPHPLWIP